MTIFRQLVFTPVLVLIRSLRPLIGMSLSDEAIKCVQSQNKPRKLRKAGSQFDRNDAELIATEYGIKIFSFPNSDFHNCPEKLQQSQIFSRGAHMK